MMQLELPTRSPSPFPGNDKDEKPSSSLSSVPSLIVEETRPSLRRALPSVDGGGGSSSQTRRVSSKPSVSFLSSRLSRSESFGRDVGHAAAETYLVTRLAITLLRYLGVGCGWITEFLALIWYATLLTRGFLRVGYCYFFSSLVRRSIIYGDKPRNLLDLYLPAKTDGLRPVLVFVTGGAWIIGNFFQGIISSMVEDVSQNISFMCNNAEAYGSDPNRTYLIGQSAGAQIGSCTIVNQAIKECGRESTSWSVSQIKAYCGISGGNFPQGTISSMMEDVSQGISFMCNNAEAYGGDPNRIYLIGQSAGAHIASCTILNQAIKECGEGESTSWSVSQIKSYFGISGGYNVVELVDHFHRRGLYQSIFLSIMEGEQSLRKFSPEILVNDSSVKHAICLMPPTILFHGTCDYSIPSLSSEKFANALHNAGAKVILVLYDGKTHTDLFLQDPLRGGRDKLLQEIISVIYAGDEVKLSDDSETMLLRRLVPEFLLKLAGRISPF